MKVFTVVGARPQFVKAGVVSKAFKEIGIQECIVHTGQHFDDSMSDVFFRELNIPHPKHNLGIHSVGHGAMTGRMLEKLEELMIAEKPDWVVVYGDTNSTLAAALAAAKLLIPVAHIEAGLRSWNRAMPEEVNRVLTDHVSRLLFCSSGIGKDNLEKEGIHSGVHVVGDVMADACQLTQRVVENKNVTETLQLPSTILKAEFVLLTIHRAENTDPPGRLRSIVDSINSLETPVVFPLHPRTSNAIKKLGLKLGKHVHCIKPLSYLEIVAVLLAAKLVITDSGGLQKEAYWTQTPCITVRPETEWKETIESNWNTLSTPNELRDKVLASQAPETPTDAYGEGNASLLVAQILDKQ